MKRLPFACLALFALAAAGPPDASIDPTPAEQARIDRILKRTPLIDGHNDWPLTVRNKAGDARWSADLQRLDPIIYDTDIDRLRKGRVGGQFWSVFVSARLPGPEQVKMTLEQIELVKAIAARYPQTFQMARTAEDVRRAHRAGRIASLMGAEGGGQIDGSLDVLRAYHDLGVGYLTLTHSLTIPWADSATDDPKHDGLTPFGVAVVKEMNRLGMLVDLSHVSEATMLDAIAASRAPVIFSHSSARGVTDHSRNIPDTALRALAKNGGVAMVTFVPDYISAARMTWVAARAAERARYNAPSGLYTGDPKRAAAAMAAWEAANPKPVVTIKDVADHVDHIVKQAGHDHVGLGGDYDGVAELPLGMDGVDAYPRLFAELIRRGWSDADLAKLAGGNILRVMERAEAVALSLASEPVGNAVLPKDVPKD